LKICRAGIAQSVVTRLRISGVDSGRRLGISLFDAVSRPALGPTRPPIQWVRGLSGG